MSFKLRKMMATALTSSALMGGDAMADANLDLVQALVSKGVLTEEEGALLTKGRAEEMGVQKKKESKFSTNSVKLRGYVQVRNTTMLGGDDGINLWSDRSVGDDKSLGDADKNFLIRRARLVIYGDYGDHLSYYIQPDFASSVGGTTNSNASGAGNFAQLRDAYGDIYFDKTRVHRIRVGQSKIPFGFENLQSSQNRLALDRNDALNSAVRDERDLGAFYYYTPETTQALFEEIGKLGLKHTGNYGQFGIGAYNGQGANARDQNDNYHVVARYTYPWKTESGQIYEAGIQGYKGEYVSTTGAYSRRNAVGTLASVTPTLGTGTPLSGRNGIDDERVGLSFMMYPQPFGLQAEWNWGKTPGLDLASNSIEKKNLNGGYVQAMYKIDNVHFFDTNGTVIPFIKYQYFDGYNKAETNSPKNQVHDWELGVEWQIAPEVEVTAVYHRMNRTNLVTGNRATASASNNLPAREDYENFNADALRVQVQYNY
ncbi:MULTISPECIES: porin [Methylotenera]|uniref:porin n=1 Tax=Methylotenera TaxID=359407 RepID=UPI00037362C3|nr:MULTISPECIES: porin [Methylotenera]